MPLIECPHCYTQVMPMADGVCPCCRKNTLDTAETDSESTLVRLSKNDSMPSVCWQCGFNTNRVVSARYEAPSRDGSTDTRGQWNTLLRVFVGLTTGIPLRSRSGDLVTFKLPCCSGCKKAPQARHINFEEGWVEFVGHRDFKRALADQQ